MRRCTRCKIVKPADVEHFSRSAKQKLSAACKVCLARLERIRYYRLQIKNHAKTMREFDERMAQLRESVMTYPEVWHAEIERLQREDRR